MPADHRTHQGRHRSRPGKGKRPGRQPLDADRIAAALKLVAAGLSPTAAARQLGLGRSTVYREVSRAGIERHLQRCLERFARSVPPGDDPDRMSVWLPRRSQAGTLLALVLLVLHLTMPALAMQAGSLIRGAGFVGLLDEVPICHADAGPASATPGPAGKPSVPMHDCALCPVCQLAATPALLPTASWIVAPTLAGPVQVALLPPSTGPPQPERYAAPPRGPPASAV